MGRPSPLARVWPALDNFYRRRDEVTVLEGVSYVEGSGDAKHLLDLFLPRQCDSVPLAVFVHGGYWAAQDRRLMRPLLGLYSNVGLALAERGVAVAVISYRQHPKATRGADSLQDIARAVRWAGERAGPYGVDGSRVVLVGHSAGGHLVSLLALDPSLLRAEGVDPATVRGYASLCGLYDLERALPAIRAARHREVVRALFAGEPDGLRRFSPAHHVHAGAPPGLLIVGAQDDPLLVGEHEAMRAALRAAGCDAECVSLPGRGHMGVVLEMGRRDDEVSDALVRFVARVCA